jgi:hypothetical protein
MDTTAAGSAPDARTMAARNNAGVAAALIESLRRRADSNPFGAEILASRGDFWAIPHAKDLTACQNQLLALEHSHGTGSFGPSLQLAAEGLAALISHRPMFKAAFAAGESGRAAQEVYAGLVTAVWAATSLIIANCVSYAPSGSGGFLMPRGDADGAGKLTRLIPFQVLSRLVKAANSHGFEEALASAAGVQEAAALRESWGDAAFDILQKASSAAPAVLGALVSAAKHPIGIVLLSITALVAALYIARDMAIWVYQLRSSWSRWFEIQAAYLEANAAALDPSKRVAREKQEGYVQALRALSERIKVDAADAERGAAESIRIDDEHTSAPGPGAALQLI